MKNFEDLTLLCYNYHSRKILIFKMKSVTSTDWDDMDFNASNKKLSQFIGVYRLHNNSISKYSQSAIKIQLNKICTK